MGLEIEKRDGTETEQASGAAAGRFTIPERLCWNRDRTAVVPAGHPDAVCLFKGKGRKIPMKQAIELGLVKKEEPVKPQSSGATKKAAKAPNKQRKAAVKDKGKGGK